MKNLSTTSEQLASLLGAVHEDPTHTIAVPLLLEPIDAEQAYATQRHVLALAKEPVGGWKVGAKSATGVIQGAPLPRRGVFPSAAVLPRNRFAAFGVELELLFTLGRDFLPTDGVATEGEVLAAIDAMGVSVEIVSSRLAGWPDVPKLMQLADFQNHGALIVGDLVAYDPDFDFLQPTASLTFNGTEVFNSTGVNPAGDPRRLLHWVVRHSQEQGMPLRAGTVITTGSYTGMFFPEAKGVLRGQIQHLPPITCEII